VLGHTVARARAIAGVDQVVVATTTAASDDAVVAEADRLGVATTRGSEDDVLGRYVAAAAAHGADAVVRITSDCPLLDPVVSARVVAALHTGLAAGARIDYASNTIDRRDPRGLDTEAFTVAALHRAAAAARAPRHREHVTLYMYEHPAEFALVSVPGGADHAAHRWTVDTERDLRLVREVFARLGADRLFGMDDVLALIAREPWIAAINADVEQKRP